MDMMVAEEVRVSGENQKDDNMLEIDRDAGASTASAPDNKFQKAIAVWRGTYDIYS
jgi:DNA/RNA-binding domain of Phe-tRNA-synthetase-like protein